jgi:hypothetical protein
MNENATPIILSCYNDLLKAKQKLELKIQKLEVGIRVLNSTARNGSMDDKSFVLLEKLVIDLAKAHDTIEYINHELDLFERKLNGGASLDKFLETSTVKTE